jgi:hypothetical protein
VLGLVGQYFAHPFVLEAKLLGELHACSYLGGAAHHHLHHTSKAELHIAIAEK